MIHELLNTLYVQAQGSYIRLDHETLVLETPEQKPFQIPLHHLGAIAVFGNVMLSPFILSKCAAEQRAVVWFSRAGRFEARLSGPTSGNVLLRKAQHETLAQPEAALRLARRFVTGKIRNTRHVLQRSLRDDATDPPAPVTEAEQSLREHGEQATRAQTLDELRGIEGNASALYFACFDHLLHPQEDVWRFTERSRRPPRNRINALLSFAYTLLTAECVAALEGVGLDPQVGYLHALRPGRPALALDLVEEFRSVVADRAVLTLVNRSQIQARHFEGRTGGSVTLTDEGRKVFLRHWQERKKTNVPHPAFPESVPLGLLPHLQARILARTLRGELEDYVPYAAR